MEAQGSIVTNSLTPGTRRDKYLNSGQILEESVQDVGQLGRDLQKETHTSDKGVRFDFVLYEPA